MARPQKLGLSYFPFDSDFFESDMQRLIFKAQGVTGVYLYIFLMSKIFKTSGYYMYLSAEKAELYCAEMEITSYRFEEILDYFIKHRFFDGDLWRSKRILTSAYIQDVYQRGKRCAGSHTPIKVSPEIWRLDISNTANYILVEENCSTNNEDFYTKNTQNKIKENKVNYIKTKPKAVSLFEKSFGGVGAEEEAMLIMYADKGVPDSMFEYAIAESEKRGRGIKYALGVIANRVNNNRLDIKKKSDVSYDLEEFESKMWEVPEI